MLRVLGYTFYPDSLICFSIQSTYKVLAVAPQLQLDWGQLHPLIKLIYTPLLYKEGVGAAQVGS